LRREKSRALHRRACNVIVGGTQTISKQPERYDAERYPSFIDRGSGCRLIDVDGNEFVDYVMALGPIVLGYCHPAVDEAVRRQLARGVLFSGSSPLEVELAEKLVSILPNAERIRLFKTGAEATSAALRLARCYTGRKLVASVGYHGWHDWWAAKKHDCGVPAELTELILDLPYGDRDRAAELFLTRGSEIACVILEPVVLDLDAEFVRTVARLAREAGALVVFDEIITGFRVGLGGMQQRLGVAADLATFGKAIANGFPLSVVSGRKEIFEAARDSWISTTFGGEALSLAAALATIGELEKPGVLDGMAALGERLLAGWRVLLGDRSGVCADVTGFGALPVLRFRDTAREQESTFISAMLDGGFLTRRAHYWFVTAAHTAADIDATLAACERAFDRIALGKPAC
jgi:glutamate-1-semialdehyde 2,1-aminomutase